MIEAFVGMGSNIRPRAHVPRALTLLAARFGPLRRSPAYASPAIGFAGADFINLVISFETGLEVHALRRQLHAVEAACGRDRGARRGSHTLDLDLLLYGDRVIDDREPCLPRPDILDYAFVLKPLAELVPAYRHPRNGVRYRDLWRNFDASAQPLTRIRLEVE